MTIIPTAAASRELAGNTLNTQTTLDLAIAQAIKTAIGNGATSCTFSIATYSAEKSEAELGYCNMLGYTWSKSGDTVTLSWAN